MVAGGGCSTWCMWERKILEDTATHCDREREAGRVRGEGGRIGALVLVPVAG